MRAVPGSPVPQSRTPSPVYRRTFVGREQKLRQLQAAFDAALSGQGSLAMVVGEPGIGKTSICEQLATYVAMRGGKALVGHCYEEGSLLLPYLPFVEAMRSYVLTREPDDLRNELGSGAADMARLVSEIRDRLALSPSPSPNPSAGSGQAVGGGVGVGANPEDDRWRLLQAVTGFLRSASTVQPLAIVLEDLHDSDRGSIDLLLHLARNLQGARLLIVGTYRDVEVDRAHPLSAALAELRRAGSFVRLALRGLTVDEVHRMYCIIRGQEVPWSRAEAIHRQTEGNPLFVQEVLRYLVEDEETVRALSRRLAPLAGRLALGAGFGFNGSVARYLGAAALLLGKPDEARAYYQQALEVCAKVRFRPEIALTRLQMAELLLDDALTPAPSQGARGQQRAEAREHLDFAIEEFGAMKMQPALERALRHKGLLHA